MQSARTHCRKFAVRIAKDFRKKELLPLKLLSFVQASTLFVLYPYLTIHMRELGINVEETAIMSAVTPAVAIIMPPLAGMVADKVGNFKVILSVFSALGGAAALLLLLVPVGQITVTYPEEVLFSLGCNNFNNSGFQLNLAEDLPCNQTSKMTESGSELWTRFETCGLTCQSFLSQQDKAELPEAFSSQSSEDEGGELSIDSILKARSYAIRTTDKTTSEAITSLFNLTQEDMTHKTSKREALSERFMKNNQNFKTAIRRFAKDLYFLPTGDQYGLNCLLHDEEIDQSNDFLLSSRLSRMKREDYLPYDCSFEFDNSSITKGTWWGNILSSQSGNFTFYTTRMEINNTFMSPICHTDKTMEMSATVFLHDLKDNSQVLHEINLENCQPSCLLTAKRVDVCSNLKKEIVYDPSLTFWVYLVIRVFIGIIGGTAFAMFEGAMIAVLREHQADYGLQRIYGAIGGMISSPLSGALIDYASKGKGYTDFRPAFYLYAALKTVGGIMMLFINLEFKSAAQNVVADVMAVLKKVEVIGLMVASFILGTAWGYIESFLFWLLQDLGGSRSLMGITITVGGVAGLPLLALSGPIIDKIGHANVIFIGFIFYAVRLLGYSLIYNPWHSLIFEAMESLTTGLAYTAAVTYAAKLSTPTTDSSIQGLMGGLYFGVGKGAGSLVGGYLMNAFGTRFTYQIFAVFTAVMGCLYYFFNKFYISKLPPGESNDICKKKPKKVPEVTLSMTDDKPHFNGIINNNQNADKKKTENTQIESIPTVEEEPRDKSNGGAAKEISKHGKNSHDNQAFQQDEDDKTDEAMK